MPIIDPQDLLRERDELRAALEALLNPPDLEHAEHTLDSAWKMLIQQRDELRAENEHLRDLLAECYPLVRPFTDLSRRLREALGVPLGRA